MFDFDYTDGRGAAPPVRQGHPPTVDRSDRLDWSLEIDLDNPVGWPDEVIPIYGTSGGTR